MQRLLILIILVVTSCTASGSSKIAWKKPNNDYYTQLKRQPVAQNLQANIHPIKCTYGWGYETDFGEVICGQF